MSFGFPELASIRLGFGLSPVMDPPADADAVLASVAQSGPGPEAVSLEQAMVSHAQLIELGKARESGNQADIEAYMEFTKSLSRLDRDDLQRRIARAVEAEVGFGERLVQFWADHFTIRSGGGGQRLVAQAFVDEAIRPHLNGRFEDMFIAADTHPMMLIYLNQVTSSGPNSQFGRKRAQKNVEAGLNENLAREAMELHSLGAGAQYNQADVRQLAELLTGLGYSPKRGFEFLPDRAEPGAEKVLGKSYGDDGPARLADIHQALRDIARNPATAGYLSRKLAIHFLSDDPDPGVVDAMTSVWRETQGDLAQVYRVMVTHPALADSLRQKARQPFDFVVAGLRALGMSGDQVRALDDPMVNRVLYQPLARMGQRWVSPNGPNGWPEEASAWITPQALSARINWALDLPRRLKLDLPDPRQMLQTTFGGTQSEALAWAVPKAESAREGVAIILASNDFNRR